MINAENTTPEPKRKKDKVIAIENKREKAKRLAFYQKELDLELTHQNIENKYLRLKALLPGIQFETKENLKAQLLEIAIKAAIKAGKYEAADAMFAIDMVDTDFDDEGNYRDLPYPKVPGDRQKNCRFCEFKTRGICDGKA